MVEKYNTGFENIKYNIAAFLIGLYVYFCGIFSKIIITGNKTAFEAEKKTPVIYAFWHNRQAYLLYPYRKHHKMCVLVSLSKDGEYIARALPKFNMLAARGSTTHGGATAFRGLLKNAKRGYSLALTPDGPRGPVYKASQGVVMLADKTKFPIIPVGVCGSRKFSVHSWDRFQIPLPFGTCAIVYGEPLYATKGDDMQLKCQVLTQRMQEATEQASFICEGK